MLAKTLREVIGERENWRVKDYKENFDELWDLGPNNPGADKKTLFQWLEAGLGEKNLLIVWESMPDNLNVPPVDITNHLTPMDWAVSVSRHLLEDGGDNSLPDLRIFILDCHSHEHAGAYGCRMVDSLLAVLPWVSVVRLLPRVGGTRSLADHGDPSVLKNALISASEHKTLREVDRYTASQGVNTLVNGWLGNLSQAGSHHDVNNLLGPLVLLGALKPAFKESHKGRRALLQHIRWLGLAPAENLPGSEPKNHNRGPWFPANSLRQQLGVHLRFVLVDDQANNGWQEVVAAALGIIGGLPPCNDELKLVTTNTSVELWATTNFESILEKVEEHIKNSDGADETPAGDSPAKAKKTDYRFRLHFTEPSDHSSVPAEVLLLDLRLVQDRRREIEYFERVLELAKKVSTKCENNWPWAALFSDLYSDVDLAAWLERYKENPKADGLLRTSEEYLEFLTLLPRIIATLDLSYPIVVFSSTGQRHVTESLKEYGNIITAFEKPRFMGYRASDLVGDARVKFIEAMVQATHLLRARQKVQLIKNIGQKAPEKIQLKDTDYVEIFIDESGVVFNGCFTVAGLILIYPQESVAENFDEAMQNELVQIDDEEYTLKWTGDRRLPKRPTINMIDNNIFPVLTKLYDDYGIKAIPFALHQQLNKEQYEYGNDPSSENHLDNLYLRLIKVALDMVLYELILNHNDTNRPIIKIFIATRMRKNKRGDDGLQRFNDNEKKELFSRYGLLVEDLQDGDNGYRSIHSGSVYPVLADVIYGRPNVSKPNIRGVVGVPITINSKTGECQSVLDAILTHAKSMPAFVTSNYMKGDDKYEFAYLSIQERYRDDVNNYRFRTIFKGNQIFKEYKETLFEFAINTTLLRQSHFLADILGNIAWSAWTTKDSTKYITKKHFKYQVLDENNNGFEYAIDGSKCLQAQDHPGALLRAAVAADHFLKWSYDYPCYSEVSIVPRVLNKIIEHLDNLSGKEYLIYCRGLHDWVLLGKNADPAFMPKRTSSQGPTPWRKISLNEFEPRLILSGFDKSLQTPQYAQVTKDYLTKAGVSLDISQIKVRYNNKINKFFCELSNLNDEQIKQIKIISELNH